MAKNVQTGKRVYMVPAILSVILIFLNVMEYCKIGERYLDLFWERVCLASRKSLIHTIYFEESNRRVMIESQFINKLHLKLLSPALKSTLKAIIQDIFSLEKQEVKAIFKKPKGVKDAVSVWSNMHGQAATSATTAALASALAQKQPKVLVAHNHIERSALEGYLFRQPAEVEKTIQNLSNQGLDALIRLYKNGGSSPIWLPIIQIHF